MLSRRPRALGNAHVHVGEGGRASDRRGRRRRRPTSPAAESAEPNRTRDAAVECRRSTPTSPLDEIVAISGPKRRRRRSEDDAPPRVPSPSRCRSEAGRRPRRPGAWPTAPGVSRRGSSRRAATGTSSPPWRAIIAGGRVVTVMRQAVGKWASALTEATVGEARGGLVKRAWSTSSVVIFSAAAASAADDRTRAPCRRARDRDVVAPRPATSHGTRRSNPPRARPRTTTSEDRARASRSFAAQRAAPSASARGRRALRAPTLRLRGACLARLRLRGPAS